MDASGNVLYGTTLAGGILRSGAIFKLTKGNGGWTYTSLKDFNPDCNDGCVPVSDVIYDASGNLYGTAWGGGSARDGVIWEIMP
jgi:hypothetical protein